MTASERSFLTRKARYEQPVQASSGGKKGGGILGALLGGMVGGGLGGGAGSIMADQGPLPDGGNLGQPGLTPTYTGGEGTHFLTLGNPNREQIKLGRFFKPRVNQEAAAALAADPLAPVQLEQPTTGVGGFFRRMFGDNANERNAALAEQQGQLRLKKWLMDQQTQGQMGVLDKQHQYEMERLKAASELNNAETQYRTQLDLQGKQLANQWALDNTGKLAKQQATNEFDRLTGIVGDPIVAAQLQEQILRAPLDKLAADAQEARARAQGTGGFAPRPVQGRPAPTGYKSITGNLIQDLATSSLLNFDPDTGTMTPVGLGGAPQGGIDPSVLGAVKTEAAELDKQSQITKYQQPPSVLGGAAEVLGDIPGMYNQAVMGLAKDAYNSPLVQQMAAPVMAPLNQFRGAVLDPAAEALKRYQLNKNRQRLQQLGTNAPALNIQ